jgi:hypothetical protein
VSGEAISIPAKKRGSVWGLVCVEFSRGFQESTVWSGFVCFPLWSGEMTRREKGRVDLPLLSHFPIVPCLASPRFAFSRRKCFVSGW